MMNVLLSPAGRRTILGVVLAVVLASGLVAAYLLNQLAAPDRAALTPLAIAAVVLAGLFALAVGVWLARASLAPVHQLSLAAQRLAEGELGERIRVEGVGESDAAAGLSRALNELGDQLRAMRSDAAGDRSVIATMLASMDDGILLVGADDTVELANPAAERILQLPEGQARGRTVVEALRDHGLVQLVRDCLGASGGASGSDGSASCSQFLEVGLPRRYLRVQASPLGSRRGLVVLQDLTEVRRADTIRRDFVANVSHELRTPLASLKALVETLRDGALDDPPAAREFLERMDVELDGLTQLVRELLELSRIESGRSALRVEEVDVEGLLLQSAERLRAQADRAGLALGVDVAPGLPRVPADPEKVQQALINLLHNAVKFTPPGGSIRLLGDGARARFDGSFEILPREAAGPVPTHVVLSVADTGVGVPADDQPRIFERFYKADKARSGGGTGLGLAIVKHVAEAHGGRVWVESVEGKGATFRIALPLGRRARG